MAAFAVCLVLDLVHEAKGTRADTQPDTVAGHQAKHKIHGDLEVVQRHKVHTTIF
jgi:hypothetical protein